MRRRSKLPLSRLLRPGFFLVAAALAAIPTCLSAQTTGTLTSLHVFASDGSEGSNPSGALVQGPNGNFYGTTANAGANGDGTVFQFTPAGTLTTLYGFGGNDGASSFAGLILGSDGNLFGTTSGSLDFNDGTVFELSSTGILQVLHTFTGNGTDGNLCECPVVQTSDGTLYGTTIYGGTNNAGTIFQVTSSGVYSTLYSFPGTAFRNSGSGMVLGRDGNFYGTTPGCGSSGNGTVFKLTPAGAVTILYEFTGGADGAQPTGVVQGSDGNFYGTTETDGTSFAGTFFQITPAGVLTTLHTFARDGSEGQQPNGGLVQGSDGNFYGTTVLGGGPADGGSVFQVTAGGTLTTLHVFSGGDDGDEPQGGLVLGSDGSFYGTTNGGFTSKGTFYRLSVTTAPTSTPTVSLAATTPSVVTGSGEAGEFTVTLSAAQDHDVVVNFTIKGTAANGTDYTLLKDTKKIKAGHTSKPINIIPQGDLGGAAKKTVVLVLAPGDGYSVGTTGKVKVKITAGQ